MQHSISNNLPENCRLKTAVRLQFKPMPTHTHIRAHPWHTHFGAYLQAGHSPIGQAGVPLTYRVSELLKIGFH